MCDFRFKLEIYGLQGGQGQGLKSLGETANIQRRKKEREKKTREKKEREKTEMNIQVRNVFVYTLFTVA